MLEDLSYQEIVTLNKTTAKKSRVTDIEDQIATEMHNESRKKYLDLIWVTRVQGPIRVRDMERSHVQNTLNWCIRKGAAATDKKDGIYYSQWIAYFTARLFDPELK